MTPEFLKDLLTRIDGLTSAFHDCAQQVGQLNDQQEATRHTSAKREERWLAGQQQITGALTDLGNNVDNLRHQMRSFGLELGAQGERITKLEERASSIEAEIVELKRFRRSITPPAGMPAVTPPDDAA